MFGEFGGESGALLLYLPEKIEFGIGGYAIYRCLGGLACTRAVYLDKYTALACTVQSLLSRSSITFSSQ